MPRDIEHLYSLSNISPSRIDQWFQIASKMRSGAKAQWSNKVVALVFLEASTRTKLSFEMAAARLNLQTIQLTDLEQSSVKKGETLVETLATVLAMQPDIAVVRHGGDSGLRGSLLEVESCPIINAGDGAVGHPTQALLDAWTLQDQWGDLQGKKLLIVGDVRHSRVASSHARLAEILGYSLGVAGPEQLLSDDEVYNSATRFSSLSEGLDWCDAVMGLRIQRERFDSSGLDMDKYIREWRLDVQNLQSFKDSGYILHPGPFNENVDFSSELLPLRNCLVREQVTNGVYLRMSLLAEMLKLEVDSNE
jgi:aspartate carbamoyltransferase catalytic subunit